MSRFVIGNSFSFLAFNVTQVFERSRKLAATTCNPSVEIVDGTGEHGISMVRFQKSLAQVSSACACTVFNDILQRAKDTNITSQQKNESPSVSKRKTSFGSIATTMV